LYSAENLRLCVMTPSWPIMSLNQVSAKAGQNPRVFNSPKKWFCDTLVFGGIVIHGWTGE
jgi:hypothetical protein